MSNKRIKIKKLKKELEEVRKADLHSALERIQDLTQFIREVACEALQDHPAEARVSLGVVQDMLREFMAGEYPYSGRVKLMKDLGTVMDQLEDYLLEHEAKLVDDDPVPTGKYEMIQEMRDRHHIYRKESCGSKI